MNAAVLLLNTAPHAPPKLSAHGNQEDTRRVVNSYADYNYQYYFASHCGFPAEANVFFTNSLSVHTVSLQKCRYFAKLGRHTR